MLVEAPRDDSRDVIPVAPLGVGYLAALLVPRDSRDVVGVDDFSGCGAGAAHDSAGEEVAEVDAGDLDDLEERVDFPARFFVAEVFGGDCSSQMRVRTDSAIHPLFMVSKSNDTARGICPC